MENDPISRRAAVDALAKEMPRLTTPDGSGLFDREIQIADEAFVDCMTIINELPVIDIPRWIPCSERLPKYGKTVLITNAKGNVSYGRFHGVEFWKEGGDKFWQWKKNTIEHVLAWMPLPEPYKEEEDGTVD